MASPTWFSAIGLREWGTLPNSNFNTSGVLHTSPSSSALWTFWSGGIINPTGVYIGATWTPGTFLIFFGGGHTDYGGNEVLAYGPLENDSPQCYRLRDRTSTFPQNVSEDGSGNPVSRHTYSSLAYVGAGGRNWMICAGGLYRYTDADVVPLFHYYDFSVASPNTNQPWGKLTPTISAGASGNACVFDGQYLWFHPDAQSVVARVDVINNTTFERNVYAGDGRNGDTASAFDSSRGIWAMWGATGGIRFFRTNSFFNSYYNPSTTGTAPTTATGSIIYDEALDCFIVWTGGATLYRLTPPATNPYSGGNAWTWSSETPGAGATPNTKQANGTFGRFQRVSSAECQGYILCNQYNDDTYFFRTGAVVGGGGGGLMRIPVAMHHYRKRRAA
jgi:hypothetical protein